MQSGADPIVSTNDASRQEQLSVHGIIASGEDPVFNTISLQQLDQYPPDGLSDLEFEIAVNDPIWQLPNLGDVGLPPSTSQVLVAENFTSGDLTSVDSTELLTRLPDNKPMFKQSANLIVEALCAVPQQMLRRATLPPFIHPQWHRSAMPEPLAVCMCLAQMFVSRTSDIKPFLWRTILAEQKRIVDQVRTSVLLYKTSTNRLLH